MNTRLCLKNHRPICLNRSKEDETSKNESLSPFADEQYVDIEKVSFCQASKHDEQHELEEEWDEPIINDSNESHKKPQSHSIHMEMKAKSDAEAMEAFHNKFRSNVSELKLKLKFNGKSKFCNIFNRNTKLLN